MYIILFLLNIILVFISLKFFVSTLFRNSITVNILATLTEKNLISKSFNQKNDMYYRVKKLKTWKIISETDSHYIIEKMYIFPVKLIFILQWAFHRNNAKLRSTIKEIR